MQFLYHNVLFLMLIPVVLLMFLIITNKDSFQKYFSEDVLHKLSIKNKYMGKTTRNVLFFISLILMVLALARPVANEKEISLKQNVASVVVAIDVSKSMLANDIFPNRLTFAKKKLLNIIDLSKNNALAVILFAKNSFILSPVTQDFNSLKILVNNFDTGINFDNGSNIFSTLEATNKLLKEYENKNLILLTDGGNNTDYKKEIEYAKKQNINVYIIAMATNKAAPIKLENGNFMTKKDGSIVTVKLNDSIKELGLNTNGGYINYSNTNDDIKQILADINRKSKKKELESKKFKTYTELFYYPLALAIFILFIAFSSLPKFLSKRFINSFLIFSIVFISSDLKAFEFDFQNIDKANEYYKKGEYKKAAKEYEKVKNSQEAIYDLGNSFYKQKEYKKALEEYKNVVTSNKNLKFKKLHNMGNSYVKLNDLENAKKAYENALKIKEDKETKENLEKVLKALKNSKKQQNQNNQQNNKQKDNKNDSLDKKNEKNNNQQNKNQQKNSNEDENKKNDKKDLKKQEQNKKKEKQDKKEQTKAKASKIKKDEISNLEEKKWLRELEKEKTPILLKEVETKNSDNSDSTPW